MVVDCFAVHLVRLGPAEGRKTQKTRPCVMISPDELNRHIRTVIVAPMTTKERPHPIRVSVWFQRKSGQIVLDQIRTIDKTCLMRRLGRISNTAAHEAPLGCPGRHVRTLVEGRTVGDACLMASQLRL